MVRAPFDGVVDQKDVVAGRVGAPGKALFTLVDDDPLKLELSVPERAVDKVKKDMHVDVSSVAAPGKTFGATITRLGAEIGQNRALIDRGHARQGQRPHPRHVRRGARDVIDHHDHVVIPKTAVVRKDKTWRAFVDKNGVAEERIVQLGNPPSDGQVSVLQGIDKGEKVDHRRSIPSSPTARKCRSEPCSGSLISASGGRSSRAC